MERQVALIGGGVLRCAVFDALTRRGVAAILPEADQGLARGAHLSRRAPGSELRGRRANTNRRNWSTVGGRDVADLNEILERLEPALGAREGEPRALDGGITNRNFQVRMGGCDYVIRQPGSHTALLGIDREAERLANAIAAQLGIAPAVAAKLDDCLVTRYVACTPPRAGELGDRAEELARALHSFHHSRARLPSRFWVPDLLDDYAAVVARHGGELPGAYAQARAIAGRVAAVVPLTDASPCHNDLLAGNIICTQSDGRLMLVDWEYAGMGHPYFDLANLSVNNGFDERTDERLLSAYHGRAVSQAERAMLALMRLLSDAREAAWAIVQRVISDLDFDFAGYAHEHFDRLLDAAARPEFEDWLAYAGGTAVAQDA